MKTKQKDIEYNRLFKAAGGMARFVEHPEYGLRTMGFADDIVRLNHKGWYTMDDGDDGETYRGVVYQLPARDGKTQYVPGYVDSASCGDGAILFFGDIEEDKAQAARAADRLAEMNAEDARDYNRAWQAGRRYEDLAEDISRTRDEALAICLELRHARKEVVHLTAFPSLCATLRDKVFSLRRRIVEMYKEREDLFNDYGRQPGFQE